MKLLIIEDEALLLNAIQRKLTVENIDSVPFTKAEEALEFLKSPDNIVDGIWLDYHLQGMDGLAFIQEMKGDERLAKIPIVVVSNSANEQTVNSALALGADRYLLKASYRLEDIIKLFREIVTLRRA